MTTPSNDPVLSNDPTNELSAEQPAVTDGGQHEDAGAAQGHTAMDAQQNGSVEDNSVSVDPGFSPLTIEATVGLNGEMEAFVPDFAMDNVAMPGFSGLIVSGHVSMSGTGMMRSDFIKPNAPTFAGLMAAAVAETPNATNPRIVMPIESLQTVDSEEKVSGPYVPLPYKSLATLPGTVKRSNSDIKQRGIFRKLLNFIEAEPEQAKSMGAHGMVVAQVLAMPWLISYGGKARDTFTEIFGGNTFDAVLCKFAELGAMRNYAALANLESLDEAEKGCMPAECARLLLSEVNMFYGLNKDKAGADLPALSEMYLNALTGLATVVQPDDDKVTQVVVDEVVKFYAAHKAGWFEGGAVEEVSPYDMTMRAVRELVEFPMIRRIGTAFSQTEVGEQLLLQLCDDKRVDGQSMESVSNESACVLNVATNSRKIELVHIDAQDFEITKDGDFHEVCAKPPVKKKASLVEIDGRYYRRDLVLDALDAKVAAEKIAAKMKVRS